MTKIKLLTIFIAAIGIASVMLGLFLFSGETEDRPSPELAVVDKTSADLGITYLPVNRGPSE